MENRGLRLVDGCATPRAVELASHFGYRVGTAARGVVLLLAQRPPPPPLGFPMALPVAKPAFVLPVSNRSLRPLASFEY
jgi:hypothetical protein